jgi:outer membrane protein assembly factor BamB
VEVGDGYATPLVVGDTVYVFTRQGDDEVMTGLSAETGEIQWRTAYAAPYDMFAATAAHGPGPKATPLFHNGLLYAHGISGIVTAYDATDGRLVWQKPAPSVQPLYGTAVSPIGEGHLVILHPGYGPLTAFDANTGDVEWEGTIDGTFASPVIVDVAGIRQVVSVTQADVVGVSLADGALLWRHPWPPRALNSPITPLLHGETILVSGSQMGVTALTPTRSNGEWSVDIAWDTRDVSLSMSNPVVIGDTLFGLSELASGQYFALDARTGNVLWLGPPRAAENTAVVKAGDLLLLLNDDAELLVAKSSRTEFELLTRYTVADSATWAQPAISGNRVFVKDRSTLALWTVN